MYEFSSSTLPLGNPKSACFQLQIYVNLLGYLFLYFLKFFTFLHWLFAINKQTGDVFM